MLKREPDDARRVLTSCDTHLALALRLTSISPDAQMCDVCVQIKREPGAIPALSLSFYCAVLDGAESVHFVRGTALILSMLDVDEQHLLARLGVFEVVDVALGEVTAHCTNEVTQQRTELLVERS